MSIQGVPERAEQAARRQPLIDRRGSFTFCVEVAVGSGTESDPLIALSGIRADSGPLENLNTMWAVVNDEPFTKPTAAEVLVLTGDLDAEPQEPEEEGVISLEAYQLAGMAGPGVQGVDIVLTNGLRITATLQNGIWDAWRPASEGDPSGASSTSAPPPVRALWRRGRSRCPDTRPPRWCRDTRFARSQPPDARFSTTGQCG